MPYPLHQLLEKIHRRHAQRPAHGEREYEKRHPVDTGRHRYAVRHRRDSPKRPLHQHLSKRGLKFLRQIRVPQYIPQNTDQHSDLTN